MHSLSSRLVGFLVAAFAASAAAVAQVPSIGLLLEKENTATYLETLSGFEDKLQGLGKAYRISSRNAGNDRAKMENITKEFAQDSRIDVVVILGSAAATIGSRNITTKPVILGGVNHPRRLGISGDNVTGASYYISPSTVVHLITLLNPSVKKVGILYEPSEQNAASLVEVPEAENALRAQGIDVVKEAVRTRDEIADRVNRLVVAEVDFVVIPTNRLLYSNVPEIRAVTDASGVPIVSFARQGVKAGAMIGITSNNRLLGSKVAEMLVRILEEHSAPNEIDWYFPEKYSILLNEESRARLGFRIPRKIQRIATIIDPAGE